MGLQYNVHWLKGYGSVKLGVSKEVNFEKAWGKRKEGKLPMGLPPLVSVTVEWSKTQLQR